MTKHFSTANDAVQSIIDEFSLFDDWMERYEYIVELGQNHQCLSENKKIDRYKVKGCQSQVWIVHEERDGLIHFEADSDAIIVRGLIALLMRVYSGRTPQEIACTPPTFFDTVDLGSHLSGSRANGLSAMVNHIRAFGNGGVMVKSNKN